MQVYYGTKASGDDGFFTEENGYGNLSAGARFILVHLAASYANGSSDAFSGANTTAQNLAKKLYNYCISQPDIPDVAMSFSDADVTAYVDGNSQRTKEITFKADELQSITMKLPSGVKLHNVTTGKTSKAGEAVEISGGTKFYLSAPLTQVQDVAGSWSATMKGSVMKDYSAYKISTGSGSQDLALVFGEGVDDEKYVDFKVTWVQHASVKVIKKDAKADAKLSGAVFGLLPFLDYGQLGHNITRVINNAKVSDHHAILPTKEAVEKGISDLTADKKNLMMLVCQQLVQATGEEYQYEQTDIMVKCQGHDFTARGKVPVQMGFKAAGNAFKNQCVKAKPEEETEKETSIPYGYEEGMTLSPVKAEKTVHFTSPPKPFNEDTLLAAMETAGNKDFDSETEKKGLGTPATRAGIIEKLVSSGYAVRKGKQILPSTEGRELVNVMPAYLKSAAMTAEWESQLLMMEKGQITDTQFMGEITSLVGKILSVCREIPETERRRFQKAREVIGKCPVCGSDVYEGKQNFYCSNRQCDFALWKENRFLGSMEKTLDKKMAVELLDKACTHVKGLYSRKKDIKFDADLLLTLEDGKPRFHLEFPKKKKK